MAVTSIWPIKGRVDKVINYARNPEKTHDKKSLLKLHEIEGVIEYAADEMKTETRALVTCLNLSSEENAAKEFMEVKHRYRKEDGRVCYHGYQSFKADEVDADTAHNIGVALAKELWGDRFQVVIATHCNTGHYHNHFVINSVSDVDGLKFYNSPEDYRHMREVSDRLCREAWISVIENPDGKKKNYGEWIAEKNGKPTVRDTIRADIDRAILASTTERDFISVMEEMGYKIETKTETGTPRQHPIVILHGKKHFRLDIFWEMNEISYETEEKTETVIIETDDGEGNIIEEEVEETTVYLYITVSHKTVEEMMAQYGFAEDQKVQVAELLAQDSSMWASVLYGIYGADDQIVAVALSQLGNVGGEPYWSWYGFGSRVEWCACFVSWCADQCGYIETGVIPKYAGCVNGVNWFKDRGQWADNDIEPAPGMIIFFDWDNKGSSGPQDGESDHTGIVERVEDGIVYTVEGNSGDSCRENHYAVGYYEILGYGIPAY